MSLLIPQGNTLWLSLGLHKAPKIWRKITTNANLWPLKTFKPSVETLDARPVIIIIIVVVVASKLMAFCPFQENVKNYIVQFLLSFFAKSSVICQEIFSRTGRKTAAAAPVFPIFSSVKNNFTTWYFVSHFRARANLTRKPLSKKGIYWRRCIRSWFTLTVPTAKSHSLLLLATDSNPGTL